MLFPCLDLHSGRPVHLAHGGGRNFPVPNVSAHLHKSRHYQWLHIIDLDAAMDKSQNDVLVASLCKRARREYKMKVRVGGGIRTIAHAKQLAKLGATQIIIGSAVFAHGKINLKFLHALTRVVRRKKIVIALDTCKGKITINGWRKSIAVHPQEVMPALEPYCAAFLCTDVDREGTLSGANLKYFAALRSATTHPIIAAGGIKTRGEIAALTKLKMDAAVGMALYKNLLR